MPKTQIYKTRFLGTSQPVYGTVDFFGITKLLVQDFKDKNYGSFCKADIGLYMN